MKFVENTLPKG